MLWKFDALGHAHSAPKTDLSGYADGGRVFAFAEEAMAWAVDSGLVQGTPENRLLPDADMTRAELAALLCRYDALYEN